MEVLETTEGKKKKDPIYAIGVPGGLCQFRGKRLQDRRGESVLLALSSFASLSGSSEILDRRFAGKSVLDCMQGVEG